MEALALVGVLLVISWIVTPIFAIIAKTRADRLQDEVTKLRAELNGLKKAIETPSQDQTVTEQPPIDTADAPLAEEAKEPSVTEPKFVAAEQISKQTPAVSAPTPELYGVRDKPKRDWERLITANWMVWAGGLALAMGAVFLVRVSIEAGLLGPMARTICAAFLGVGLISGGVYRHLTHKDRDNLGAMKHLPSILTGAGIIALYGASLAAGVLYGLAPPLIVLGFFILISILAVGLALILGPVLAAIGIAGAYITPFFTGAEGGSGLILLPYAWAVTSAGLGIIAWRQWRFLSWLTLIGGLIWGVVGLIGTSQPDQAWIVPVYIIGLLLSALWFSEKAAWVQLDRLRAWRNNGNGLSDLKEALIAVHMFWIGGGVVLALSLTSWQVASYAVSALAFYSGLSLLASWQRPGFAFLTPIAAVVTFSSMALWSIGAGDITPITLAAGMGFGLHGYIVYAFGRASTPVAATSALSPPTALFLVFWKSEQLSPGWPWALAALFVALLMVTVLEMMRSRDPKFTDFKGAAASYALGGILSAMLAPFLTLSGYWLGAATALIAAACAITHSRFDLRLLREGARIAGAVSAFLLFRPTLLSEVSVSTTPVFNEISASFLLSIAAFLAGAWLLRSFSKFSNALLAYAGIVAFSMVGLLIRHAAGGGQLDGPFGGYSEASGYAIAYLGGAVSLAWRFRSGAPLARIAEYLCLLAGMAGYIAALNAISWDRALGAPVFNLVFVAFAMPAILFAVYAAILHKVGRSDVSRIVGWASVGAGLVWLTLEVRRAFVGELLSGAGSSERFVWNTQSEMWSYSIVWLLYAVSLLIVGVWRKISLLRHASLVVLLLVVLKVFLSDLQTLEGVWRALSFMGLGATLLGVALSYQRFVFRADKPEAT